ncbi:MAG: amidase [Planctomycetales bacterium]|nr:amidase [Planctomycetales bacterium]
MNIPRATIDRVGRQLARRERSCVDLVQAHVAQIEQFDGELRAWVAVERETALEQAEALDCEIAAGKCRGPLHGIPLGIKDIIDVAAWDTRAGSRVLCRRAERDAGVVDRLRRAGVVLLGKTVTTEFACFDPPPTRNPWNAEHTPGGSSSGSAVAVATGMCTAALGSQTGGSITRPASYCGVAGLKPTIGRVSTRGVVPVSHTLDHVGVIARSVADLGAVYNAIAGFDVDDPWSVDVPTDRYVPSAHTAETAPPRLGVIEGFFRDAADEAVRAVTDLAVERLREAGAHVDIVALPERFADVIAMHRRIMAAEAAACHRKSFPDRRDEYGEKVASLLDEGWATSSTDYAEALAHRQGLRRDLDRLSWPYDALVTPATTTTAPSTATTGDARFNAPWSYSGLPTVSMPCGLAEDGLPVALQLVGGAYSEPRLLGVGQWCESQLPLAPSPPQYGASE